NRRVIEGAQKRALVALLNGRFAATRHANNGLEERKKQLQNKIKVNILLDIHRPNLTCRKTQRCFERLQHLLTFVGKLLYLIRFRFSFALLRISEISYRYTLRPDSVVAAGNDPSLARSICETVQ